MLVIGHRGARGHEPENTYRSFERALSLGVRWIECDIQCSVDRIPVIIHDRSLERTTNGRGLIAAHTAADLQQLDAGDGEGVPLLSEVLVRFAGRAKFNFEIKNPAAVPGTAQLLRESIRSTKFQPDDFLVSSFDHRALHAFQLLAPNIRLGLLNHGPLLSLVHEVTLLNLYSVNLFVDFLRPDFIDYAHQFGLKVFVYTINDLAEADRVASLGVDGIFTDFPEFHSQRKYFDV